MTSNVHRLEGFVPDHVLREALTMNPGLTSLLRSAVATQRLYLGSRARVNQLFRFVQGSGTGARQIFDAQEGTDRPGVKVRFEGDPAVSDAIANASYDQFGIVREFYQAVFGRNSIDANGMLLKGVIHFDKDYDNAFWDGEMMTFGDGDGVLFKKGGFNSLNVTIHELTHGVTEYAVPGGVTYYGQAGALNEHLSDQGAASCESRFLNVDALTYHWLVGAGIWVEAPKGSTGVRRALRDMLNPGTAYNDPRIGQDRQRPHMSGYIKTNADNGGVHLNSGIPNRAFALFSRSLGAGAKIWEQPAHIWYAARPNVGNNPSFAQFAYHTIEACAIYTGGEENALRTAVTKAWSDVGVTASKVDGDLLTPPFSTDPIVVSE